MKCCSTADRLKEIMQKRNLKQVDILNKSLPFCSKYNVLGVTEAWLMGFDVSPMRKDTISAAESDFDIYYKYSLLDDNEKEIVIGFIDSLLARKKK